MSVLDTLITNRTQGAYYNATDVNRVNEAIMYVASILTEAGYPVTRTLPTDWTINSEYFIEDADRVTEALNTIRDNFGAIHAGGYPQTFDGLTFTRANQIEQFLLNVDALLEAVKTEWINKQTNTFQTGGMLI